ncbi:MAG: Ppx/GppA phosphatase family protein [Campylobacterota bacterium]|nr:Ppx/GppA phosphatase family protein [Campylobacterota bacterium]
MAKRTAIIDIGSNSVRMVVFEKSSRFAFHLLHEIKSPVRISEGAYENGGALQDAAQDRAIGALRDFLSLADSYKVRKILCVATSAVRDASNRSQFLSRAKQELQLSIKVIDGEKEAYFGGIACANLLAKTDAITIDIGGGSTECAHISNGKVLNGHSLNIGTVRLKELFFDKDDIKGAKAYIDDAIATLPIKESDHIIGVGGTFRALSNAIMKREAYRFNKLHGYHFDAKIMIDFGEKILKADTDELKALGIKPDRFDIIKSGTLILLRIINRFKISKLTASGVGVREGVYLNDLLRHQHGSFPANFNPSVRNLIDRRIIDHNHANHMAKTAGTLFDLLHVKLDISPQYRSSFVIAAKLSKIGTSLHFYSYHQHGYYLIQSALEYGFTHKEIMLIATLIRYQKRKRAKREHKELYASLLPKASMLDSMSQLLRLTDTLLSHHPRQIDFELSFENRTLEIKSKKKRYLSCEKLKLLEVQGIELLY